jgi:hypothetical protein
LTPLLYTYFTDWCKMKEKLKVDISYHSHNFHDFYYPLEGRLLMPHAFRWHEPHYVKVPNLHQFHFFTLHTVLNSKKPRLNKWFITSFLLLIASLQDPSTTDTVKNKYHQLLFYLELSLRIWNKYNVLFAHIARPFKLLICFLLQEMDHKA